jgi:hypothetical protein
MYSTSHQIPQQPSRRENIYNKDSIYLMQKASELQVRQTACPSAIYQITGIQLTGDIG